MRPILANLVITSFPSNSFSNSSTPPLNKTPGSSPLLRPISSPMTPITPLVLGDSTTTGNGAHYEKENFFSHEDGYFFHGHNEERYTASPYYQQVTVNISPLSSGATTPTNTFNKFNPNSAQAVNHYTNHSHNHHQTISTAPSHISSGIDYNHYHNYHYNQQIYDDNNNNAGTLDNAYHHHYNQNAIQNQDDAQFREIITGLSKMDI